MDSDLDFHCQKPKAENISRLLELSSEFKCLLVKFNETLQLIEFVESLNNSANSELAAKKKITKAAWKLLQQKINVHKIISIPHEHARHKQHLFMKCSLKEHKNAKWNRMSGEKFLSRAFSHVRAVKCFYFSWWTRLRDAWEVQIEQNKLNRIPLFTLSLKAFKWTYHPKHLSHKMQCLLSCQTKFRELNFQECERKVFSKLRLLLFYINVVAHFCYSLNR